ncbi:MAG: tRNA (5-methylaminomethyl-2-thiouridine)(34)-methyltransferase MnmD [Bacteroidota bacterium]
MSDEGGNQIVMTADGSHSIHSKRFAVAYHSTHGAVQESEHVFLQAGLIPLVQSGQRTIMILEMGFGTGLNALLVRRLATQYPDVTFCYHTLEQFPLTKEEAALLNYPEQLAVPKSDLQELHELSWGELLPVTANFHLEKQRSDFLQGLPAWPEGVMDLIFYDAFAPASQPELWTPAAINICFRALRPGGILVTYCAKGQYKRDLKAAGFAVEALPGPPGKREMTRATKQN